MSYTQSIIEKVLSSFDNLKVIIDKDPNAFQIQYDKETGYFLFIDLDLIKIPQEEEHRVLE